MTCYGTIIYEEIIIDKFIKMQKIKGSLYPPKSNKNPPNRGPIA